MLVVKCTASISRALQRESRQRFGTCPHGAMPRHKRRSLTESGRRHPAGRFLASATTRAPTPIRCGTTAAANSSRRGRAAPSRSSSLALMAPRSALSTQGGASADGGKRGREPGKRLSCFRLSPSWRRGAARRPTAAEQQPPLALHGAAISISRSAPPHLASRRVGRRGTLVQAHVDGARMGRYFVGSLRWAIWT